MKKEVIIAILIGFGIGLIITFGIYRAQKAYQITPQPTPATDLPSGKQVPPSHSITVTSPENLSVHNNNNVVVTGTTSADSYVTAVSNEFEEFTKADSSGNFSISVELETGANLITLSAIDDAGTQAQIDTNLIYSSSIETETNPDQNEPND